MKKNREKSPSEWKKKVFVKIVKLFLNVFDVFFLPLPLFFLLLFFLDSS